MWTESQEWAWELVKGLSLMMGQPVVPDSWLAAQVLGLGSTALALAPSATSASRMPHTIHGHLRFFGVVEAGGGAPCGCPCCGSKRVTVVPLHGDTR